MYIFHGDSQCLQGRVSNFRPGLHRTGAQHQAQFAHGGGQAGRLPSRMVDGPWPMVQLRYIVLPIFHSIYVSIANMVIVFWTQPTNIY